jgi:5'-nucleotidase
MEKRGRARAVAIGMAICVMTVGAETLTIAGTADLQGMMNMSLQKVDIDGDGEKESFRGGGITRIAEIFRQIKAENPLSVFLSSGDDLMGRFFHTYRGKAIYRLMSEAGYDYVAFGNHEFDHGPEELAEALPTAGFSLICSDLILTGGFENKTDPWGIREFDGMKVGIFSLMTAGLPGMSNAGEVRLMADNVTMARRMVSLLKEKGADVIIALTHIGYKSDVALAKQVKGIDLIFGGHSHQYPRRIGHIGKTAIVNGGEHGAMVVRVDMPLDEKHRVLYKKVHMSYVPVKETIAEPPGIKNMLKKYNSGFPPEIVLGKTGKAWDMTPGTLRKGESTVADMINDLLREKFNVDIVLNNSGSFRGKSVYPAGPITDRMLQAVDEFRNTAYIMELDGSTIRKILEHSASEYGKGGWLQVSGIRYRVDMKKPFQKIEGDKIIRPGKRVGKIMVFRDGRWVSMEETERYRVLSNSFLVLREGDGYFWFRKNGKNPQNTFTTFYSVMAEYLEHEKNLTPPVADGRIEVIR